MKVGFIRCMQTEDMCPGSKCFQTMRDKKDAFADLSGELECVGVNTCGGCPGKKAASRAVRMVKAGAEAIVISSCISLGTPMNFPCPFGKKIRDTVKDAVGEQIMVLDYSHAAPKKA